MSPFDPSDSHQSSRKAQRRLLTSLVLVVIGVTSLTLFGASMYVKWQLSRQTEKYSPSQTAQAIDVDHPPGPDTFFPVTAVGRQPVVVNFDVLPSEEASQQVHNDETVLAVEVNGEHRAYPINVMTGPEREIFNDRLGGVAIAATW